jgi:hypothetical protein
VSRGCVETSAVETTALLQTEARVDRHNPRLVLVEAVAQRNSGVHRSQSHLEAILTDVIYGSLGAFDGQAGLI